jgi:FkbH-like protein
VNYLEAHRVLKEFKGGEPLHLLLAMSGTADPLGLFIGASGAVHQRSVDLQTLPFNTLGQFLLEQPKPDRVEVFLLLPWDLVPESDWRSGLPRERPDFDVVRTHAFGVAERLSARREARFVFLPAPLAPVFADPARDASLELLAHSLAAGLGATFLSPSHFSLTSYLANGCPAGASALGDVAEAVIEAACRRPAEGAKLLVTDLDNVMWAGVIAEDGLEGVAFSAEGRGYRHFIYQTALARLRREGVLLAAVSRNDLSVALEPFRSGRMVLKEDDFVTVMASYNAKSSQIREIASKLNLGLDSFVFIDDNPVEISEVSLALPQVRALPFPSKDDELPALLAACATHFVRRDITEEDQQRTELYRRRLEGIASSEVKGADLSSFLRGLEMSLTIHDRTAGDRTRVVQLINKTNQFNLNGRRVTEAEVTAVLEAGGRLYGASLSDRTGSHGEILSCLITPDGRVTSFVMSCRVFQRRVENAFLVWLARQPNPPARFAYASTERNEPFRQFAADSAFSPGDHGDLLFEPERFASTHQGDLDLFALTAPAGG